jgi:predicted dehydrogenase
VADIRADQAREIAEKADARVLDNAEALIAADDVDVVDICLPTYMHAEWAIKAMEAGKHVLCEKPMALTESDARKMADTARSKGVKFMVAHVIRFWPEYQVLKRIHDSAELGELLALSLRRVSPNPTWSWQDWLNTAPKSGAALVDLHVHDADFVRYLLGEPKGLSATGTRKEGGWDYVFCQYFYPNKAVSAEAGWNLPPDFPFSMAYRAVYEKGTLDFNTSHSPTLALYRTGGGVEHPELPTPEVGASASGGNISDLGGYFNEIQYFIECVEKDRDPSVVTPDDACKTVALVENEIASAEEKLKL